MSSLSFWLSRRLSKKSRNTVRTGNVIAILGIAFAVAIMEITLAVAVGFKQKIAQNLLGFVAPVTIVPAQNGVDTGESLVLPYDGYLKNLINENLKNADAVAIFELEGILKTDDDFAPVSLRAFQSDYSSDFEKSHLINGQWVANNKREIVLSNETAKKLQISVGDKIALCFFRDDKMKVRQFNVAGIYDTGLTEYDKLVAYVGEDTMRGLLNVYDENEYSAVQLRNIPLNEAEEASHRLADAIFNSALYLQNPDLAYGVQNIYMQGAVFLNWLKLLDTNVIVIFILMTLVAACTLTSSLFIQVLGKVNAIGLLRSIGATGAMISSVFRYITMRLVLIGIIIGNILGLGLIYVQSLTHFITLDAETYYLEYVPVQISLFQIILLNIGVIVASWLIILLPAKIATRLSPASTLKYD